MSFQLRFIAVFGAVAMTTLTAVIAFNFLVDPLWYFGGNQLNSYNEPFNERVSKINLLSGNAKQFDCVIFGPSVTTQLDASKIRGHRCFNAAFSDARVEELPIYARYIKNLGLEAKLVIVDLTPRNLSTTRPRILKLPEFIQSGTPPASAIRAYAAVDAFWFSLQSALSLSNRETWYDAGFNKHLGDSYPKASHAVSLERFRAYGGFDTDSFARISELLAVWPEARSIGVMSFVGVEAIVAWQDAGMLDNYIATSHRAGELFDAYYDFTAPSEITTNPALTPDGLHFAAYPNDVIAARLNGENNGFGLDARHMPLAQFKAAYMEQVGEWLPVSVSRISPPSP